MKRTLFTIISALFILSAKAQKNDTLKGLAADTLLFTAVEHEPEPEFPGGVREFYRFLGSTVKYPASARDHSRQGRVLVSMIVEKDGTLSHIKIARGVSDDLDNEALRAMNLSPKWNPGIQNGKVVRVAYIVPLTFTLSR